MVGSAHLTSGGVAHIVLKPMVRESDDIGEARDHAQAANPLGHADRVDVPPTAAEIISKIHSGEIECHASRMPLTTKLIQVQIHYIQRKFGHKSGRWGRWCSKCMDALGTLLAKPVARRKSKCEQPQAAERLPIAWESPPPLPEDVSSDEAEAQSDKEQDINYEEAYAELLVAHEELQRAYEEKSEECDEAMKRVRLLTNDIQQYERQVEDLRFERS